MTDRLFEGKVVLVTGAGSGIGRATAQAFAAGGARVAVCDINLDSAADTVARITAAGGEAMAIVTDVSDSRSVAAMVEGTVNMYGRLDCAFNNAGVFLESDIGVAGYLKGGAGTSVPAGVSGTVPNAPPEEWDEEIYERTLNINAKGVMLCMKYEIRQMLRQGGGAIVNTASIEGFKGIAGHPGYGPSKHAVIGLTRVAAVQYAKQGIRVNAVCPGAIRTAMSKGFLEAWGEEVAGALHPMGRMGEPEEIAHAVLWLCSEQASFVTGHPLAVDGGVLAQ